MPISPSYPVYDLRSDTVTKPTPEMIVEMSKAECGDDVYGEDPSIVRLEEYMAKLTGKEAALFCSSGTMSNQLGLRALLTSPPHSVLSDARAHVYKYECGGIAYHSQANITPVTPANGRYLTMEDVRDAIVEDDPITMVSSPTRVISLENTHNGMYFPIEEIRRISQFARSKGLSMHLDGARLWNASVATETPMHEYGALFDTLSICLSKGVGAPIGSILVADAATIAKARRLRKLFGGGWRQAGMLAVAAQHAIDRHVVRMQGDHADAAWLASQLEAASLRILLPVQTNMVFFGVEESLDMRTVARLCNDRGIRFMALNASSARLVFHFQVGRDGAERAVAVITEVVESLRQLKDQPSEEVPTTGYSL
ncbi:MAG: pyridoxal phosphate-dependent transferase [Piptocephalis tieghemiana]|nr:MAG: pyridoxal phosphate-dependent transferase [Piptocephalis tieghemiana]